MWCCERNLHLQKAKTMRLSLTHQNEKPPNDTLALAWRSFATDDDTSGYCTCGRALSGGESMSRVSLSLLLLPMFSFSSITRSMGILPFRQEM